MNLMIDKNELRSVEQANPTKASADILSYDAADSDIGKVLVARSAKGVCSILLGESVDDLTADLGQRFPMAIVIGNALAVKDDLAKVLRYIEKPAHGLDLMLDMRGTPFQRRVWEKMRAVPAGRTVSYTELARWVSPLANPRAVARACAANPIALAIPCHRIIRSDGDLAGYRWGMDRKRALIEKEILA
jgi:methylated-DNA-[protein]-cysteine S-methyltransferase/AraC family transcriptional regulator of adaptative response/methylated-DNA-[protein]-cysteine methyltransferase